MIVTVPRTLSLLLSALTKLNRTSLGARSKMSPSSDRTTDPLAIVTSPLLEPSSGEPLL